jgi:prevent-host-death family protein
MVMEEINISEFKAKCLALMERVRKTKKPLRVTKFGKPVVDIVPSAPPQQTGKWLGCMRGTAEIVGDIVSPVTDPDEWEVLRD